MAAVRIVTGPALVGHVFADSEEVVERAVPVLVGAYVTATGLDVSPTECSYVECSTAAGTRWTELRLGSTIIASWTLDEMPGARIVGADSEVL